MAYHLAILSHTNSNSCRLIQILLRQTKQTIIDVPGLLDSHASLVEDDKGTLLKIND